MFKINSFKQNHKKNYEQSRKVLDETPDGKIH